MELMCPKVETQRAVHALTCLLHSERQSADVRNNHPSAIGCGFRRHLSAVGRNIPGDCARPAIDPAISPYWIAVNSWWHGVIRVFATAGIGVTTVAGVGAFPPQPRPLVLPGPRGAWLRPPVCFFPAVWHHSRGACFFDIACPHRHPAPRA